MEKKFYTDNFEQFLKETADDFRMYPSKRVWNSIYNNLHPGKKWPSLAVSLLLVSSMLYIGISHKNEITGIEKGEKINVSSTNLSKFFPKIQNSIPGINASLSVENSDKTEARIDKLSLPVSSTVKRNKVPNQSITTTITGADLSFTSSKNFKPSISQALIIEPEQMPGEQVQNSNKIQSQSFNAGEVNALKQIPVNEVLTDAPAIKELDASSPILANVVSPEKHAIAKPTSIVVIPSKVKNKLYNVDKEWIEDYAFHNKPKEKWRGRLAYQFYATPSIGYRNLANKISYDLAAASSLITATGSRNADVHTSINQSPSLNLEAGGSFLYGFSKQMRLKAGLQLNYTNYKIRAYELKHTTSTTLLLADPNTGASEIVSRSSDLANTSFEAANKKLNSNTYQVSLPVGADLKLAGKNRLQWYAGATIQPTYIVGGNGYLISSDLKNYVYDASFLRKWNLNAAIETFFSYKLKEGIILNAGPQLRYQFLSTYKSSYSYDEKLYNLGVKMGITRNF